jgi:hypothetical protein
MSVKSRVGTTPNSVMSKAIKTKIRKIRKGVTLRIFASRDVASVAVPRIFLWGSPAKKKLVLKLTKLAL